MITFFIVISCCTAQTAVISFINVSYCGIWVIKCLIELKMFFSLAYITSLYENGKCHKIYIKNLMIHIIMVLESFMSSRAVSKLCTESLNWLPTSEGLFCVLWCWGNFLKNGTVLLYFLLL